LFPLQVVDVEAIINKLPVMVGLEEVVVAGMEQVQQVAQEPQGRVQLVEVAQDNLHIVVEVAGVQVQREQMPQLIKVVLAE
jgi:hypothetical protein